MRSFAVILLLAAMPTLTACSAARVTIPVAQEIMSQYGFVASGYMRGDLAANSRFLFVRADVALQAEFWGPRVYGGPPELLWERSFEKGVEPRAYEAVPNQDKSKPLVEIKPVDWNYAVDNLPLPEERKAQLRIPEPAAVPETAVAQHVN